MKNNMKIMMMVVAGIAAALVVVALPPTTVYGQQTTVTPTEPLSTTTSEISLAPATQQIISDARTACSEVTPAVLASLCVSVVHESPTTLVLDDQLLIVREIRGLSLDTSTIPISGRRLINSKLKVTH